jgi:uncharacterized protein with ParB-like and HNH nuclease domain
MPSDTDVASYFEIMNNRGRQLEEHEILKALLMSKIPNPRERIIFGNVWDACSQMDMPIHKFFNTEQRTLLFGETYDSIYPARIKQLQYVKTNEKSSSIVDLLNVEYDYILEKREQENNNEIDEDLEYTAIIDFSNFLIHVLKLTFKEIDIPLSSDKLLKIYNSIPKHLLESVSPMKFVEGLFFYRVVFDRFIVKSEVGSENADQYEAMYNNTTNKGRWTLVKPVMYWKTQNIEAKDIRV